MNDERLMRRLRAAKPVPSTVEPTKADQLFTKIVNEPGDPRFTGPRRRSLPRWLMARRPLAAGTGVLAAAIVGAVLLLGGTATTQPAFAITRTSDGTVLVKLDYAKDQNLPQVNAKLTAMGTHEQVTIYMATGPASVSGPVTCTAGPGAGAPNPPIEILDGTNGTEVIAPGESGDNTAEGTFHLDHCTVAPASDTGPGTGNTGNPGAS